MGNMDRQLPTLGWVILTHSVHIIGAILGGTGLNRINYQYGLPTWDIGCAPVLLGVVLPLALPPGRGIWPQT
jgi:hypothetical protein